MIHRRIEIKKSSANIIDHSRLVKLLAILLAAAFVFSCTTVPESVSDKTALREQEPDKSANKGACVNPYYPVQTKIERKYKVSGSAPATYVLKHKLREKDGFTEHRNFASGIVVVSNWSCNENGMRNADYNNAVSSSRVKVKMETLESSGITFPKIWEKGKKWTADYKIRAKLGKKSFDGTVTVENEIISMDDNISVQGGDYVAARIDSVIKIKLSLGARNPSATEVKMSNWYARDFGLVKQESKSPFGDSKVEYAGEK